MEQGIDNRSFTTVGNPLFFFCVDKDNKNNAYPVLMCIT